MVWGCKVTSKADDNKIYSSFSISMSKIVNGK